VGGDGSDTVIAKNEKERKKTRHPKTTAHPSRERKRAGSVSLGFVDASGGSKKSVDSQAREKVARLGEVDGFAARRSLLPFLLKREQGGGTG